MMQNRIRTVFIALAVIFAVVTVVPKHANAYVYPWNNWYNNYSSYWYPNYNYRYQPTYYNYYNPYYSNPYYWNYNYDYGPLTVACYPSLNTTSINSYITWAAYASGGTRDYTYSWTGTDYVGSTNSNNVSIYYSYPGTKTVNVTVWSGGQSATVSCGQAYVKNGWW